MELLTDEEVWGIRTKQELRELCETSDLVVGWQKEKLAVALASNYRGSSKDGYGSCFKMEDKLECPELDGWNIQEMIHGS
jgi:hypothetical protein